MRISISWLRAHYPEQFGIRKFLQIIKVNRITRYTLSKSEIEICEADPSKKEMIIAPYLQKWEKYLRPCISEMNAIIEKSSIFFGGYDLKKVRTDMLFCRLAYGFIPSEYIGFGFIDKNPEERKNFCSDLDTHIFGYSVNNIVEVQRVLNKATSAIKYQKLFCRDFIIVEKTEDFESFSNFIKEHPIFVKKKVFSSMGKGVELVDINGKSSKEYFVELISTGKWLLEECVTQRREMSCFNESSVNTVRCITFNTVDGVIVPYCFMRTGRNGAFVDNGGLGGLLMGINVLTGIVDTDGFDEYGNRYTEHPNSGIQFKDFQIPQWDQMIEICKSAAEKECHMNYVSWDMAYGERGWCVIEVNEVGQFIGPQMVYQRGIKKELNDYLERMHKVI